MTAFGLYPTFTDRKTYKVWRQQWAAAYNRLTQDIREHKIGIGKLVRYGSAPIHTERLAKYRKDIIGHQNVAKKMMTLLDEATQRRDRILAMHTTIKAQNELFPLDLGECKNIDFHFNKGHIEFPFLPMWTIRAKGRSYYVQEVEFDVPCTTRERATGSTKGVLRFTRGHVMIDNDGVAKITKEGKVLVDQFRNAA